MKRHIGLVALLAFTPMVWAQALPPAASNESTKALLDSLAKQLAPCLNSVGLQEQFPVVPAGLKSEPIIASSEVPSLLSASDHLQYSLSIRGSNHSLFILQYGGIAGRQVEYGPIALNDTRLTCHSTGLNRPGF
jgi:hypothetical protein